MLAVFLDCFCCLSMLCEVTVTKPAQAQKKTKKNKPLDAPNLHRHQKYKNNKIFQELYGSTATSE